MKKLMILVSILTLSGCANTNWKAGLGVHTRGLDAPEYDSKNPLGFVRGETPFNPYFSGFFEHESMIFMKEEGLGYNKFGVMLDVNKSFQWFITQQQ